MASGSKKLNIIIGADTRKLNSELKKSTRSMQKFGRRMSLMGTDLIRSVTIPLVLAGGALLKFGAELDASKRALTAVMGSSKLASKHFLELKEAAKAPGLDFRAAIQGTLRFQSMGISAETATKTLTAFGKAVALSGGGADEFARTIQQLSDMFSRQKVTMEDWRRVITAAPTVVKALRDEFDGMTDAVKIASEVGFDEFMTRLTANLNAAAGPTNSLGNSFNNLASSSRHVAGELGLLLSKYSGLQEYIGKTVTKLDKFAIALMTNKKLAKEWGEKITFAVKALAIIAGTGLITKIIGSLTLLGVQFANVARGALLFASAMTGIDAAGAFKIGSSGLGAGLGAGGGVLGTMIGKGMLKALRAVIKGGIVVAITYGFIEGLKALEQKRLESLGTDKLLALLKENEEFYANLGEIDGVGVAGSENIDRLREIIKKRGDGSKLSDSQRQALIDLINTNGDGFLANLDEYRPKAKIKVTPLANEAFTKIMEKYRDSVTQLNAEFKLTGDRAKKLETEISNLQGTIVDLEVAGFTAGKAFEDLNKEFEKLVGFAEALESLGKGDESFFEKINAGMPTIRAMPTTLGADTALPGDKAAARAALLSSEIAGGINPSDEDKEKLEEHLNKVAELQDRITGSAMAMGQAFAGSFIDIIDGTKTLADAFKDFFKNLMKKLLAAIAAWTILTILSGGTSKLAGLASGALKNIGGLGGLIGQSFGFGAAEGGVTKQPTGLVTGEYVNAYNKPEMTGRVDQWAGLIRDFMSGHNMVGGQQQPELALRGEDIWRMYNRTDNRMKKMGVTG